MVAVQHDRPRCRWRSRGRRSPLHRLISTAEGPFGPFAGSHALRVGGQCRACRRLWRGCRLVVAVQHDWSWCRWRSRGRRSPLHRLMSTAEGREGPFSAETSVARRYYRDPPQTTTAHARARAVLGRGSQDLGEPFRCNLINVISTLCNQYLPTDELRALQLPTIGWSGEAVARWLRPLGSGKARRARPRSETR